MKTQYQVLLKPLTTQLILLFVKFLWLKKKTSLSVTFAASPPFVTFADPPPPLNIVTLLMNGP